ncbi:MAG: hypothetical protein QMD00_05045 [Hadesarchaea archaeon]|nr:hypothetical protein [Hadesarchaea archaeon]
MSRILHRVGWGVLLFGVLLLTSALAPPVGGWGSSVHHDQAITISNALKESPSIPAGVRENVDTDTIYAASLSPDDWRGATGEWGTWQYNMAENAYYEFIRIRDAWAAGDFDNAIFRIGVVLHYTGDVMYMPHNFGIRKYYENYIEPLGSASPLWGDYETGKYFTANEYYHASHYNHQQVEAYTDSDSAWYPLKPENYGTAEGITDNGSLDWFLRYYFRGPTVLTSDINTSGYSLAYVMPAHIRQSNPYDNWSLDDKVDNRWFYWVKTRDPDIAKQDADNTIRLTYNGVYRALRDGEWRRQGNSGNPPSNWSVWDWPTKTQWLSPRPYGEGMDTIRWAHGISSYGSNPSPNQETSVLTGSGDETGKFLLITVAGLAVAALGLLYARHLWRDRRRKSGSGDGIGRWGA